MKYTKGTFNILAPFQHGIETYINSVEGFLVTEIDPDLPDIIVHVDITTQNAQNWMAAEYTTGVNIIIGWHTESKEEAVKLATKQMRNPSPRCRFSATNIRKLASIKNHGIEANVDKYAIRNQLIT